MHGPHHARPFHRRRRSGPSFWAPDAHYTCLVTGEESGGAYCAMHVTVPPGGGPPSHVHRREDATFYVLEGTPTFYLEDERVVAIPGDFVNVPKGTRHGFRNISLEPVRMVLTFMPAGIERRLEQRLERAPDTSL